MSVKQENIEETCKIAECVEDSSEDTSIKEKNIEEIITIEEYVQDLSDDLTVKEESIEDNIKIEEGVEDTPTCWYCNKQPCVIEILNPMLDELLHTYAGSSNKTIRYFMYEESSSMLNGYLGKGVRKRFPHCVEERIRSLAPSQTYTGFKEASNI